MNDRWAGELADIARRLARLTEAVAADWPDRRGQDWTERAGRLHRELLERSTAAAELGSRVAEGAGPPADTAAPGVRLGGLDGRRTDDGRGVRLAELSPN